MTDGTESMRSWTGEDLPEEAYAAILEQLRLRRGFDLDAYKDRCIRRRIAKRLRSSGAGNVTDYLDRLVRDDDELDALLATLSIHVSQFFRNPDTFQVLERKILPDLCRLVRASGREVLRLWSVGCAGGEEPYSLAMLIDEMQPEGLGVSILGTDVSAPVLADAANAVYEPARLAEVPVAVRGRYFEEENGRYRLLPRIRDRVSFKRQNVMAEEAFPPADLILCRNVLIYFTRDEQARILARFADSLPEGGVLVLGRAETLTGAERQLFRTEFPVERIYRRTAVAASAVQGA